MTHTAIAEGLKGIRDAAIGGTLTLAVLDAAIAALEAEPLAVIEGGIAPSQLEHAKRGPDNPYDFWEICCRGPGFIPVRVAIYEDA